MNTQLALIAPKRKGAVKPKQTIQQRILLYPNELYRIPVSYHKLRVVAGTAFVTHAARDIILGAGHEVSLDVHQDFALVSVLKENQLIIELYGEREARQG